MIKRLLQSNEEPVLEKEDTVPIFHHDFRAKSVQAGAFFGPRWLLLLKRIDPIHLLMVVFFISLGVTIYAL